MSLARRAFLTSSRSKYALLAQRRSASSSSHGHHEDHHHQEDATVYAVETFGTSFWRNVVLGSLATMALFKLAPVADDDVYLTRWIAMYCAPRDHWLALNAKHTALQAEVSEGTLLVNDAQRPTMHRFVYPQSMVQASPFLNGVGMAADMRGIVPKTEV